MKKYIFALAFLISTNAHAVTECNEKVKNYFVGTSEINQPIAHLWVSYEGGGSASVSSESKAYDSMLSSVMTALITKSTVKVRYLTDNADCKTHHKDWVGLWVLGQ